MHGRTASQGFRGSARWQPIARLKEALAIPVIGNGDVRTPEEAVRMLRSTGCDGVMIGRGATRNPWIFRQTAGALAAGARGGSGNGAGSGEPLPAPTLEDRRALVLGHFRTVVERDERGEALHKLRRFTGWYSHGLPGGQALRRQINDLPDPESFLAAVEAFFDQRALEVAA
jgi:tRNA-dihydrouridine synthase